MIKTVDLKIGQNFGKVVNYLNCDNSERLILKAYRTILNHLGYLRFTGWEFEVIKNLSNFPICMHPREEIEDNE